MLEVAVIADDLTGAADTGIQFRRNFSEVLLLGVDHLPSGMGDLPGRAVSIHTDSRGLPPGEAAQKTERASRALGSVRPGLLYKKVDSCLRGNLGQEIMAVLRTLDLSLCLMAPALPKQGRQTLGGVHLVHGRPVAQSEVAQDPVCPVTESRLDRLLASQSGEGVGLLGLEAIRGGPKELERELSRLRGRGFRIIACDAQDQADLDRIARQALGSCRECLFAGSAGLAESLSNLLPRKPAPVIGEAGIAARKILMVCGSTAQATRHQIEALRRSRAADLVSFAPGLLDRVGRGQEDPAVLKTPGEARPGAPLVLRVENTPVKSGATATNIVRGLALVAGKVLREVRPEALFLTGGDTAAAVLDQLGSTGLRLDRELRSGLVLGRMLGGGVEGLPVACKPGAFGGEEYLVALLDYWENSD